MLRRILFVELAAILLVIGGTAPIAGAEQLLSPYAPLKLAGRLRPDVGPIDMAMHQSGDAIVPIGPISVGDIAGSMPFSYSRTAVLMSNLKGRSIWNRGFHENTNGAPGFYVGRYRTSTQFAAADWELWCFLPSRVGGADESICLFLASDHQLEPVIIIPNKNPFWPDKPTNFPQGNGVADGVVLKEEPVTISPGLTLKYRFLGWTRSGAHVEFLVADHVVGQYNVKFEPDGSVNLGLLAGSYIKLTHEDGDLTRANSRFFPTGASFGR